MFVYIYTLFTTLNNTPTNKHEFNFKKFEMKLLFFKSALFFLKF